MDLSIANIFFGLLGGVGIFLYGMKLLSEGLQNLSQEKIRQSISKFTKNKLSGLITGTFVTAIVQSSSIFSVMVISFVNSGLLGFAQSVPLILGANIGSTLIVQLISLKMTSLAFPLVAIGAFFYFFEGKNEKLKSLGLVLFGLGLIFLAMNIMKDITGPIKDSALLQSMILKFNQNTLLALALGLIITALVQSSALTVGMVVVLASAGLIDLAGAIPIIFGASIGTCITAIIASYKTTMSAKRVAAAHTFIRIIGVTLGMYLFPFFVMAVAKISPNNVVHQIANFFTLFNTFNALIFLPFSTIIARHIERMFPGDDSLESNFLIYLNYDAIKTPRLALVGMKKEIGRLYILLGEMIKELNSKDSKVKEKYEIIKSLRNKLDDFAIKITEKKIEFEEAEILPLMNKILNEIDRATVHSKKVCEFIQKHENIKKFSKSKKKFLNYSLSKLEELNSISKEIFEKPSKLDKRLIKKVKKMKEEVYKERKSKKHTKKNNKEWVLYNEILENLERVVIHYENMAYIFEENQVKLKIKNK